MLSSRSRTGLLIATVAVVTIGGTYIGNRLMGQAGWTGSGTPTIFTPETGTPFQFDCGVADNCQMLGGRTGHIDCDDGRCVQRTDRPYVVPPMGAIIDCPSADRCFAVSSSFAVLHCLGGQCSKQSERSWRQGEGMFVLDMDCTGGLCSILYWIPDDTRANYFLRVRRCSDESCNQFSDGTVYTTKPDDLRGGHISCPTSNDCKIFFAERKVVSNDSMPILYFVDCDDETCAQRSITTIEESAYSRTTGQGRSFLPGDINCPRGDACSLIYTLFTDFTPDNNARMSAAYLHCYDSRCTNRSPERVLRSDATVEEFRFNQIACPVVGQCSIVMQSADQSKVFFHHCNSEDCSAWGETLLLSGAAQTVGGPSISCLTADHCRVLAGKDQDAYFFACDNETCTQLESASPQGSSSSQSSSSTANSTSSRFICSLCEQTCASPSAACDQCLTDNCGTAPDICEPVCGDGFVHLPEGCDDGNVIDGDGCDHLCAIESGSASSGSVGSEDSSMGSDGSQSAGSDDSSIGSDGSQGSVGSDGSFGSQDSYASDFSAGSEGSEASITIHFCGDGIREGLEVCDQGEANADNYPGGCSTQCTWNLPHACADNLDCSTNLCEQQSCAACTTDTQCGNQRLCLFGRCASCGDAVVTPPELCDDGNDSNDDSCSNRCLLGVLQACQRNGECASDLCLGAVCSSCSSDSQCGAGRICLQGGCARCGDGIVTPPESCDDANIVNTDACSNRCRKTLGQSCRTGNECTSNLCGGTGVCQACSAIASCGSTEQCVSGACVQREECMRDRDCRERAAAEAATQSPLTANIFEMPFLPAGAGGTTAGAGLTASVTEGPHGAAGKGHAPVGDTGPAALAIMAAGAAVGGAWMRRKKKSN